MLEPDKFDLLCRQLNLSEEAVREIQRIRSSPPARRVRSGPYSMAGRFNRSNKMDHTIQFESRTVEYRAILTMEVDEHVLEMWDQPPSFVIHYKTVGGRNIGDIYTADFFVLRDDCAGWEEWKTESQLINQAEKNPNKYCRNEDGTWRFLPGERYAHPLGLYFRVYSSAQINWTLLRNFKLLKPYIDELENGYEQ